MICGDRLQVAGREVRGATREARGARCLTVDYAMVGEMARMRCSLAKCSRLADIEDPQAFVGQRVLALILAQPQWGRDAPRARRDAIAAWQCDAR